MLKTLRLLPLILFLLAPAAFYSNPALQSSSDVNVSGSLAPDKVKKGRVVRASVVMDIPAGLHVQSNKPFDKFLIATKLRNPRILRDAEDDDLPTGRLRRACAARRQKTEAGGNGDAAHDRLTVDEQVTVGSWQLTGDS